MYIYIYIISWEQTDKLTALGMLHIILHSFIEEECSAWLRAKWSARHLYAHHLGSTLHTILQFSIRKFQILKEKQTTTATTKQLSGIHKSQTLSTRTCEKKNEKKKKTIYEVAATATVTLTNSTNPIDIYVYIYILQSENL